MRLNLLFLLAAVPLAAQVTAVPEGYRWDFLPLGSPRAVTNDGRIVGPDYLRNADGSVISIRFPGSNSTTAVDGNSAGVVAGDYSGTDGRQHGFLRGSDGAYTTVEYPGATATRLLALTDAGLTLGYATVNDAARFFTRSAAGAFQDVTPPPNGTFVDLASDGTLLATSPQRLPLGEVVNLWLARPGQALRQIQSCGSTRGGTLYSLSMNDATDIALDCFSATQGFSGRFREIRAASGTTITLGSSQGASLVTLSTLVGINNRGQVVGTGQVGTNFPTTVLLTPCRARPASTNPIHVPASGGVYTIAVEADAGCRAFSSAESPLQLSDPGFGPGNVSLNVPANPHASARQLNVRIGGVTIEVMQDGATAGPCAYSLSTNVLRFDATAQSSSFALSAPEGCAWTLTGLPPWMTLFSGAANGSGSRFFNFDVAANSGPARSATLSVAGLQVTVTQSGPGECTFYPSRSSYAVQLESGAAEEAFSIVTNAGCSWTFAASVPWLRLQSSATSAPGSMLTGIGPQAVWIRVEPVGVGSERSAVLQVGAATITITQTGRGTPLQFVPLPPCRILDTRPEGRKTGPYGPPSLTPQASRVLPVTAAACGVPSGASTVAVNVTAVPKGSLGFVTAWPANEPRPLASTLNSFRGRVVANAAIVPLRNGAMEVFASNETDLVIDVNGYFQPATAPNGLAFYPVTPCRVADTRVGSGKTGEFGPPAIPVNGGTRSFRLPASGCGIPASARAFALNITAVPVGYLAYVTTWATGQTQPFASTLNSWDGQVAANSAIIPAGTDGAISVYATNPTDIIVDVAGYFAPPATGGLNFHAITPCRAVDTRTSEGRGGLFGPPALQAQSERTLPLTLGSCGLAVESKAYSANFTVVPPGPLGFLSVWPTGVARPGVSTLNSFAGDVVANGAMVPAGAGGAISVFASNPTELIVDVNGFFLP